MITRIDVSKIEANRDTQEAIMNMKFNINFDDVKVSKDDINVAFTFTAVYETGQSPSDATQVGKLTIMGNVLSKESKKDADDIKDTWESKKTLPIRFAEDIINILNFECGARGTLVAYSIGFVAPLPISRAKLQEGAASSAVS